MIRSLRLISDKQNTLHVFNSIYGVYYVQCTLRGDGGLEFSKNRFFFYISKV